MVREGAVLLAPLRLPFQAVAWDDEEIAARMWESPINMPLRMERQ